MVAASSRWCRARRRPAPALHSPNRPRWLRHDDRTFVTRKPESTGLVAVR